MLAWLVGASYTIGPVIVGTSYFEDDSAGNITASALGSQLHEVGLAAGGTCSIAPGLALFLAYLYGERRQNGFNFITGMNVTNGTRGTPPDYTLHNKVTSQVIGTGLSFAW
jgi:predicted porin